MVQDVQPERIAEDVAATMRRVYGRGLTTLSGGNVSVRDRRGAIWITPGGRPKDSLLALDVVVLEPDGTTRGRHASSSETPLHRRIYERRVDLNAVVHAHPTALVAHSLAHHPVEVDALPSVREVVGGVAIVPYALTGSLQLGELIGEAFAGGIGVALLENHGPVAAGADLATAFRRLETLETAARITTVARRLIGSGVDRIARPEARGRVDVLATTPPERPAVRAEAADAIADLAARAYRRGLLIGGMAAISMRVGPATTLVTPPLFDAEDLPAESLRSIELHEEQEIGSIAARHATLYRGDPAIHLIIEATPVHATAFALAGVPLTCRTIPESLMLLGETVAIASPDAPDGLRSVRSSSRPATLLTRRGAIVVAANADEALDRLEVLELTAQTLVEAATLGGPVLLDEQAVEELGRGRD